MTPTQASHLLTSQLLAGHPLAGHLLAGSPFTTHQGAASVSADRHLVVALCGAVAGLGVWILVMLVSSDGATALPTRLTRPRRTLGRSAGVGDPRQPAGQLDGRLARWLGGWLGAWLPTPAARLGAGAGVFAGIAAALVLRLPVLALLAVGIVVIAAEASANASAPELNAKGAAVAAWTESVRQELDAGQPLLAALIAACDLPPAGLEGPLARLGQRLRTATVPEALWAFAAELDHPAAGASVAALEIAYRHGAGDLPRLMARQVENTRHQVQTLRETHAARARTRRSMLLLLGLFVVVIAGLFVVWPTFLSAYRTPTGQAVLAGISLAVLAAVRSLLRMSTPPAPVNFFTHPPHTTTPTPATAPATAAVGGFAGGPADGRDS